MARRIVAASVGIALALPCAVAGATPPGRSKPDYGVLSESVTVTMDDGIKLAGTLRLPTKDGAGVAPGRFPALLQMTPYGKDADTLEGAAGPVYFTQRGYATLDADIRGAGASGGDLAQNYFSPRE